MATRNTPRVPVEQASRKPVRERPKEEARAVLTWLEREGTRKTRDGMARYRIPSDAAFGVPFGALLKEARRLGRNHELAAALWETGRYEARLLASLVDEPERVTAAQMDRWCRDFGNWAVCDTVCFKLFDQTPHAFEKAVAWAGRKDEIERRAAFALMASLALHDKLAGDAPFFRFLPLIERATTDERNFVKKGVSWALRSVGERSPALHVAAMALARQLAGSPEAPARWVGTDALRQLSRPAVTRRLAAKVRGRTRP